MQSDFEVIVERKLILLHFASNIEKEIVVRIGRPYWTELNVEAACPVAIVGMDERREDIHGIDPLNALELAIKFVDQLLSGREPTEQIKWPDGEPYFD